jgi:GMP synthase-like glutamine amidotransferase
MSLPVLRVALLDLNNGAPNEGLRCLRQILSAYCAENEMDLFLREFDVRRTEEIADLSFQVYFFSGGPGSPLESEGSAWEKRYFTLIENLEKINSSSIQDKKYAFFICHSFQLICRHYDLGEICQRKSTAFGVMPIHKYGKGFEEPLFSGLPEPFYAVDSRDWQVIRPNKVRFGELGAELLAIEKERPGIPLERAMMAIRFSPWFFGTQFHPEADAQGMTHYLERTEKKHQVIAQFGLKKYHSMLTHLNDPGMISLTRALVIPTFLDIAVGSFQETMYG